MAEQIIRHKSSPEACVQEAFERVFLKPPSPPDVESAMRFIGTSRVRNDLKAGTDLNAGTDLKAGTDLNEGGDQRATMIEPGWHDLFVDYCHVLINSNSFLHLE